MKTIYVDNNATTRVAPEVFEEMTPYLTELYGNPSSMHFFGGQVQQKVEEARERVAGLLGARPQEIIFTSCGTESDNAAIMSALQCNPEKRHVLTTRVEHPAVKNLVAHLKRQGYRVTELPVDRHGLISMEDVSQAITADTAIVSVMWANNETGVLFPVEEIATLAKSRGVIFHTDAVQAVGKIPINMAESQIDMLSLSGHKLHAPKGIGVLYVRRGTRFAPFVIGGHQEGGRRGGTENVPYIIGLGKACEMAAIDIEEKNLKVKSLRDKLENGLLEMVGNSIINGDREQRLPNTSSISFEYVEGESILLKLSDKGICASSGSACTSGSLEPSHVLRAMGVPFTAAHGSIRFSLSSYNTEEEIDYILEVVPPIIEQLREISPFWKGAMTQSCAAS
ncbi:MAG: cysteine desulfurase NifS [Deltaproteobacteria bacterium]|nr:cysteine desulfurase NifS [Deltaproteobacteria bacterium]